MMSSEKETIVISDDEGSLKPKDGSQATASLVRAIDDISSAAGARSVQRLNSNELIVMQKLRHLTGAGPNLASITSERALKLSVCSWLAIGNLPPDMLCESTVQIFLQPFGRLYDIYINEDEMVYVKFDSIVSMERAAIELVGTQVQNRKLHLQWAPNAATVLVKNLTKYVSNELLFKSFEIFGAIERACIIVDTNMVFTGQGVVEFSKKKSAHVCIRMCHDRCFFITSSLRPCIVEFKEFLDEESGIREETIPKNTAFRNARGMGPRFAELGSIEHMYGSAWKELFHSYNAQALNLERQLRMEEEKLETQLEFIRFNRTTQLLGQELRKCEADMERMKFEWNKRLAKLNELNEALQCDQNGEQCGGPRRNGRNMESCPRCSVDQPNGGWSSSEQ